MPRITRKQRQSDAHNEIHDVARICREHSEWLQEMYENGQKLLTKNERENLVDNLRDCINKLENAISELQ